MRIVIAGLASALLLGPAVALACEGHENAEAPAKKVEAKVQLAQADQAATAEAEKTAAPTAEQTAEATEQAAPTKTSKKKKKPSAKSMAAPKAAPAGE